MSWSLIKEEIEKYQSPLVNYRYIGSEFSELLRILNKRDLSKNPLDIEEVNILKDYLVSVACKYKSFDHWNGGIFCNLLSRLEVNDIYNVIQRIGYQNTLYAIKENKTFVSDSYQSEHRGKLFDKLTNEKIWFLMMEDKYWKRETEGDNIIIGYINEHQKKEFKDRSICAEFSDLIKVIDKRPINDNEKKELSLYLKSVSLSYKGFRNWRGGSFCEILSKLKPKEIFNILSDIGFDRVINPIYTNKTIISDYYENLNREKLFKKLPPEIVSQLSI